MGDRVKLAIIDSDLKVRKQGKYEISERGDSIKVITGGENHFQPKIDGDSYLEFYRRSLIPPFRKVWERVYFVRNKAPKCVNFKTLEVFMPDAEQLKKAVASTMLSKIGREETKVNPIFYVILIILIGIALKVFGVIV